jgi:sugar phosphate isomerase/epimerase
MYICLNRATTGGGLSLEDFVQVAASAGFAGADVDMTWGERHGVAALRDLYAARHMRFGGWGPPVDHRTEPARRDEGLKHLAAHADIARQLQIDSCATWIMPSSDLPFLENWKFHVDRLKPVAQVLADHNRRLGLEFVSPYHLRRARRHEFIYTPGLMLELADAVGPNVGLLVDFWHVHWSATPWQQIGELSKEKIVWCHWSDAPNLPPEKVSDGRRLLPGQGVMDFKAAFAAVKQTGFDGPVSLEAFHAVQDLPPQPAARKAWQACEAVLQSVGNL